MTSLDASQSRAAYAVDNRMTYPDGAPITVGDEVRCERSAPSNGTWPRYAGRTGTVAVLIERIEDVWIGEVGVAWGSAAHHGAASWVRPDELVRLPCEIVPLRPAGVGHSPHTAVSRPRALPGQSRRQTAKKQLADQGVSK